MVANVQGQESKTKPKARTLPVEIFQVLGLPLNIHEAVLIEKDTGFVLECRFSSESNFELLGLRYSLSAIDAVRSYPLTNRSEGFRLKPYDSSSVTFATPMKLKPRAGLRVVLMLEQVLSQESIWEVIRAKDALEAYLKGDYSIQPNVLRVINLVDAPPVTRVIY
jgi:hypothetical protein